MLEVASITETSADFYQTTQRVSPEDKHLHTRRLENLKYHLHTLMLLVRFFFNSLGFY
jgi:hypothetical protein